MATQESPHLPTVKSLNWSEVEDTVTEYVKLHDDSVTSKEQRASRYQTLINSYYNLATDFYEWGWGQSFHFAPQTKWEGFQTAIARHEHYLALKLGLQKGWKTLDCGCGVGGPARNLAVFTGAQITGINLNKYQIERATSLSERQGLSELTRFVRGDFMHQPFEDNTFDAAYQIEATPHAPDKVACFKEILRVLKPGQYFAGYEWCLTDRYDPENEEHRRIKKGIEEGDGLPDIATCEEVNAALLAAGFELVESYDMAEAFRDQYELPWYHYISPSTWSPFTWHPSRIQFTSVGRYLLQSSLGVLEKVHVVPKGTTGVSRVLHSAADALVLGGELRIFTPMFFHLARKPFPKEY